MALKQFENSFRCVLVLFDVVYVRSNFEFYFSVVTKKTVYFSFVKKQSSTLF